MNATLKNIGFTIFSWYPLKRIFQSKYEGVGSILFLHKVVQEKYPEEKRLSMMNANELTVAYLEQLIQYLHKNKYQMVSLDTMHSMLALGKKPNSKFICITFDDGYLDNLTLALPVFRKYQVPFAVYVTNCFPNKTANLWWNLLEEIILENDSIQLNDQALSTVTFAEKNLAFEKLRDQFIHCTKQKQDTMIASLEQTYQKDIQAYVNIESLDWEQLRQLAKDPLVTIGAHTMNHIALNALTENELIYEVTQSQKELEEKLEQPVHHFAYPFGTAAEITEREHSILQRATSYKTATTTRAANIFLEHKDHLLALPRLQVLGNWKDFKSLELHLKGTVPAIKNKFKRIVSL